MLLEHKMSRLAPSLQSLLLTAKQCLTIAFIQKGATIIAFRVKNKRLKKDSLKKLLRIIRMVCLRSRVQKAKHCQF